MRAAAYIPHQIFYRLIETVTDGEACELLEDGQDFRAWAGRYEGGPGLSRRFYLYADLMAEAIYRAREAFLKSP
jgi:hypothetical protein